MHNACVNDVIDVDDTHSVCEEKDVPDEDDNEATRLDIRPTKGLVRRIDAYIKRQPGPAIRRADAARRLLELALARDEAKATKRGA